MAKRIRENRDVDLTAAVKMLPTPKKQNANSPGEHGQGGKDLQTTIIKDRGLKLQPEFVEYMMHLPFGYTELRED